MTDYDCTCKAVVALNNIGIYLIQHGLYVEAILTLKDAIKLMKYLDVSVNGINNDSEERKNFKSFVKDDFSNAKLQRTDTNEAINAACKRKNSTSRSNLKQKEIGERVNPINIIVVSDKDSPTNVHNALNHKHEAYCCVTVETDFSSSSYGLQVKSTIIFYNYGIALRCLSERILEPDSDISTLMDASKVATSRNDAMVASFKIMELSRSLTARSFHELSDSIEGTNLLLCCLLIDMLLLRNLYQMSSVTTATTFIRNREQYYYLELKRLLANIIGREIIYSIEKDVVSSTIVAPSA